VLTTARPVLLMELNERALHAQGQSAESLLGMLRQRYDYEILSFCPNGGGLERVVAETPLSPNVVAVPAERAEDFLRR